MSDRLLRPWRTPPGAWDRAAAAHLLRRAGFGAGPEELDQALSAGFEATLARCFESRPAPDLDTAARAFLGSGRLDLLQAWWMALILEGASPLRERLALLWHDHFATSADKVDDARLMHRQNELFRSLGPGDFRVLFHEIARDPAMLLWLDGGANRRGHPNENFAREALELFGLGLGQYTEDDVREAARAFTGWGTDGRSFVNRSEHHDAGAKTVFGRTGEWDGDDVIDRILEHPACARHVAGVLLEAFVSPRLEPAWIEETARVLVENEWHVGRTLRILLSSELFFSPAARRSRIAGPVELVAVTARTLGARIAPSLAADWAAQMGQGLFRPPSVKGWDGGRAWIHAGTWIARHNALVRLARAHGEPGAGIEVDLGRATGASVQEEVPARVLLLLLPDVEDDRLSALLSRTATTGDLARSLVASVAVVLTSPEYQLF